MLAARDQENLVFNRRSSAAHSKQQNQTKRQQTPGARFAKTPLKVPLNDENGAHAVGGAKSVLGGRTGGNENTLRSKGKGLSKANIATPANLRNRAILGDKTTNAKANGQQTVNVKSAIQEIEKSQANGSTTVQPKKKLIVHAEEEIEFAPPRPKSKGSPYKSDLFPDGALDLKVLDRKNLFNGYYDYYFKPLDDRGVLLEDKQLVERNKEIFEESDRRLLEDVDDMKWDVRNEISGIQTKSLFEDDSVDADTKEAGVDDVLSSIVLGDVTGAMSMEDKTKSLQRKATKPAEASKIPKPTFKFMSSSRRPPSAQAQAIPRKTSLEMEANSRTTVGYNKGRRVADLLQRGPTPPTKPVRTLSRTNSALSNTSDKTITSTRQTNRRDSIEQQAWKDRITLMAVFNSEDDSDDDCEVGKHPTVVEDPSFEFRLTD
ncbi:uncharacterized protein GGS22DRAFT_163194 [Annulohypoxylon maeteangense]|uniref:uncharacterized protein n=1 Tax=Annulohypoxylon maeteangense TaxID=1927788 RepID=UPI002007F803|nr:uncharacterized protein GGS22DRAFT_163194 [Annulohypoxylon maeteangense]KAI0885244.1 hypothetical protein GGS22DRAFT_163194 [Annulohypoxylon maeteangense]